MVTEVSRSKRRDINSQYSRETDQGSVQEKPKVVVWSLLVKGFIISQKTLGSDPQFFRGQPKLLR